MRELSVCLFPFFGVLFLFVFRSSWRSGYKTKLHTLLFVYQFLSICRTQTWCTVHTFQFSPISNSKYRGKLQGMVQGTLLWDGLLERTTTRRMHPPVAWALCRIDQVAVSPTWTTRYILFHLPYPASSPLLSFDHKSANFKLSSFFVTSDDNRHFGATSATPSTYTEARDVSVFHTSPDPTLHAGLGMPRNID